MTKIEDAADVRQGCNQTRSGNLWRFLPQSIGSAGLIRHRRWWWDLLAWSRWLPISFYFFYPFYPIHHEAKNRLAVGGRPYHTNLGYYRWPGRGRPPPARGRAAAVCRRRQCPRPDLPRNPARRTARAGAALLSPRTVRGSALPARPAPAPRRPVQNRPQKGLDGHRRRAVHRGRAARIHLAGYYALV